MAFESVIQAFASGLTMIVSSSSLKASPNPNRAMVLVLDQTLAGEKCMLMSKYLLVSATKFTEKKVMVRGGV